MTRLVLDTSMLIGQPVQVEAGMVAAVTAISFAELEYGAALPSLSPTERAIRQQRLARLRAKFGPGLPFDDAAASSYGLTTRFVLESGRQIKGRVLDLMIVAIAHAHGATLLTRDRADLAPLDPLVRIVVQP